MPLTIPLVPDELQDPVSTLTRAATTYRAVLYRLADRHPEIIPGLLEYEELLHLSDAAVDAWRAKLGHDLEDEPDDT